MEKSVIRNGKNTFLEKYGMIGILLIMVITFSIMSKSFFTVQNFSNVFMNETVIGCLALGCFFILLVDEFDLSLGYILCFCMVFGAFCAGKGCSGIVVVTIMIGAGGICGLINGLIVTKLHINSFIVTMSVGLTLSGISQAVSGGGILNSNIPAELQTFARGKIAYIGYSVILFLVLCVVLSYILNDTQFGRQLYAVGISKKVAMFAGIKVDKIRILAFVLAGLFAGIAAVLMLGQVGAASSAYGTSLLLPAYSIVFLSKASFSPGKLNVPGMLVGLLLCALGENGIEIAGAPVWGSYVFQGTVLIISIWLSIVLTGKVKK